MGYRLRMGLCFYSVDPQVFTYLESIFCWFLDPVIELSASKARLMDLMIERKLRDLQGALLSCAAFGGDTEEMVMNFVCVVGEMIKKERFDYRQTSSPNALDPCHAGKEGIVYADEEMISFTQKAFLAVCKACGVSRPDMVNALKDAKLVQGKPINPECSKTRISVGVNTPKDRVHVYKFSRESLDQ